MLLKAIQLANTYRNEGHNTWPEQIILSSHQPLLSKKKSGGPTPVKYTNHYFTIPLLESGVEALHE